jgi:hypothetical protein
MSIVDRVNKFVDEKEAEMSKRHVIVDSEDGKKEWERIVDEMMQTPEDDDFKVGVIAELEARGYLYPEDVEEE